MSNIQKPFLFSDVKSASLEVITGPMFSGKTTALLQRVNFFKENNYKVKCLKPKIDTRYSSNDIVTHNQETLPAIIISNHQDLLAIKQSHPDVIALDEIQFFDDYILDFCVEMLEQGVKIIATGLNKDYQAKPFTQTINFISIADHVEFLNGDCDLCGDISTFTYRKDDSKNQVLIGGNDLYETRCRNCYSK
jgi:thymidine kinase